ncbi:MAG TPA: DUF4157 domain-containing protein [Dehalococcoidia bacterium]|nr:DUF4157 domain-containing protein [Dehalococcoidia bacterium]
MDRANLQNDDRLKVKAKAEKPTPRADASGGAGLLSAMGNARVQRLLRAAKLQRQGDAAGSTVDDEVARAINSKRGSGATLDEASRKEMEPSFGQDFSDVRVHTDDTADALNRAVQAEAFTIGRDIFFRKGSYSPGSSEGKKLLAHELTHVVQQRDVPVSQDLTVSSPEDASERQAGDVASAVSGSASATIGRQMEEEEPQPATETAPAEGALPEEEEVQASAIGRQVPVEVPEEEEELQKSPIAREGMPEEEELAASRIAREGMPEEEELAASRIAREGMPEEEELAASRIQRKAASFPLRPRS